MTAAVSMAPGSPLKREPLSLEEFLHRDWNLDDGLKYEWRDGLIEAGEERMKLSELGMVESLIRHFAATRHFREEGAILVTEIELPIKMAKSYRRCDLGAFTKDQIMAAKQGAEAVIPSFIIEIISENDNLNHTEKKLAEYFASDVQVVWHVIPGLNLVRVYRSQLESVGCKGNMECSAAPAFAGFVMTAAEIFR